MAPLCPMLCEEVWRGLTNGESVHLQDYPVFTQAVDNDELVKAMNEVRDVVSATHSLRKENKLRVRQPLRLLTVVSVQPDLLEPFVKLISSEVNVKSIDLKLAENSGFTLLEELSVLPRELDPAMRKLTAQLFKAAKDNTQWEKQGENIVFTGVEFNGEKVVLSPEQFTLTRLVCAPKVRWQLF